MTLSELFYANNAWSFGTELIVKLDGKHDRGIAEFIVEKYGSYKVVVLDLIILFSNSEVIKND